jgi:CopG family nickel-responsive transcriptional regulator
MGFSGRSEVIRAAIRLLPAESKEKETLVEKMEGIVLLIHEYEAECLVTNMKNAFQDIIHTQLHKILRVEPMSERLPPKTSYLG